MLDRLFRTLYAISVCMLIVGGTVHAEDEVNIALELWGGTAEASSEYGPAYSAKNAIDGAWDSRTTDKWNSALNETPHWLRIDLGAVYPVHRIVIRHEGVYGDGEVFNTSDFRIQTADTPTGPWTDMVPPVTGNHDDVTTLSFDPRPLRHIRLFIEKGEQKANEYARIFEVEAYTLRSELTEPKVIFSSQDHFKRVNGNSYQIRGKILFYTPEEMGDDAVFKVVVNGDEVLTVPADDAWGEYGMWLPVPEGGGEAEAVISLLEDGSERVIKRVTYTGTEPGYFSDGRVHVISSSHQDIAWMDSPENCVIGRDAHVITPALERMRENPDFRFVMESTMNLMEYLERHPESREEIARYTREGRFEWGATYNQPYESMYNGEALIRQTYLGRKWLKRELPGADSRTAWSPDVPGRALQMPQILAKSGIPYLVMSRHEQGLFHWKSPDGSSVLAYSPGHYHASGEVFRDKISRADHTTITSQAKPFDEAVASLYPVLTENEQYYRSHSLRPELGIISSTDFSGPADYDDLFATWNTSVKNGIDNDPSQPFLMPTLEYATGASYLDAVSAGNPDIPEISGERPNVWLYIHGPTHHKALSAGREAWRLLPAAETFSTIGSILTGHFGYYPGDVLESAWIDAIYPDHGWGGYQGAVTDSLFRVRMEQGRDMACILLDDALEVIVDNIKVADDGLPIIVFNPLSWSRTMPVTFPVNVYGRDNTGFILRDHEGKDVDFQVLPVKDAAFNDGTVSVMFIADEVPSLGYRTYYLTDEDVPLPNTPAEKYETVIENRFYQIEFGPGGIRSLYDRELNREIFATHTLLGGEPFMMKSEGNGAGEFAEVQQPSTDVFEHLAEYEPNWLCIESGKIRNVYETSHKMTHATVRLRVSLYHTVKRLDFDVDLLGWDGTRSREFRLAFPLALDDAQVAYHVPMGVVEVGRDEIEGAAGERYVQPCAEVHPREVQDWFAANDDGMGVTISSSVAAFDWIDPLIPDADVTVLQPILLASRRSCHGEGNWYLQAGDHSYHFSLSSYDGNWRGGYRFGMESNLPLFPVTHPRSGMTGYLPEMKSFCSVSAENLIVSTVKKCETDDSVVIRCFDIEGRDTNAAVLWFTDVGELYRTSMIEEEPQSLPMGNKAINIHVGHHAIETFKLVTDIY